MYKNLFVFCLLNLIFSTQCMRRRNNKIYHSKRYDRRKGHFHKRYQDENQFEDFIDDDYQDYFDIKDQKKQKRATCEGKRQQIISYHDEIIDTEVVECNWFSQGVIIYCKNGFLKDIDLILQNVNNGMNITEPNISKSNKNLNQMHYFPTHTELKEIGIYKKTVHRNEYVYGFKFKFYNGQTQDLKCKNQQNSKLYSIQKLKQNQSLAGITYSKQGDNINQIKFHTNTLTIQGQNFNQKQNFIQISKNYELIHKVDKNQIQNIKIYGNKTGEQFTDKDFNESWNITKIKVSSNGKYINKIQTFLKQKYFSVQLSNEEHLCKNTLNDKQYRDIIINFPINQEIKQIDFQMNQKLICGIIFYFTNGNKSKNFCKNVTQTHHIKLSTTQVFLGFHGFKDDKKITSLGLLERYESRDFFKNWGVQ